MADETVKKEDDGTNEVKEQVQAGPQSEALTMVVQAQAAHVGQAEEEEEVALSFPIYHMKKGIQLPETGMYFVIGSNGIFVHKPSKIGRSLVPVEGISFLERVPSFIMPSLPKLPKRVVCQAVAFFRQVFHTHRSEAGVVIYYNADQKDFILWCPRQKVSSGSCDYDRNDSGQNEPALRGYNIVGTIHSHCDFQAFHSGVDVSDEELYDGLHITIGNVDKDAFSMCSSFVQHKTREVVEPEFCCLGLIRQEDAWASKSQWISFNRTNYYTLDLDPEEQKLVQEDAESIRKFWMPKVEKKSYGWTGGMGFHSKKNDGSGGNYGLF